MMKRGPHPDDCLGCAINRIVRRLAKEHGGSRTHLQDVAALRKFGRDVAYHVRREVERRHEA